MNMNLKPKKHKRISLNTTMTSLGFIGPPLKFRSPPNLTFCSGPPNYFGLKFLGPPKIRGGGGGLLP